MEDEIEIWRDQQEIYEVSYDGYTFAVGSKLFKGTSTICQIHERVDDYHIKGYATINIEVKDNETGDISRWRSIPSLKCVVTYNLNVPKSYSNDR